MDGANIPKTGPDERTGSPDRRKRDRQQTAPIYPESGTTAGATPN
jgi:hypothetical protein